MKILKNKRGIVFENAIIFMLVIFSLCFILTTITVINHYQAQNEINTLKRKVYLDQVGEYFLEYLQNEVDTKNVNEFNPTTDNFEVFMQEKIKDSPYSSNYGDYDYEITYQDNNNTIRYTLTITSNGSDTTQLCVDVLINNIIVDRVIEKREIDKIQSWSYQ